MIDLAKRRVRAAKWLAKNPGYRKAYYEAHKEESKQITARALAARSEVIAKAKDRPCMDCGQKYAHYIMDFDHRPGENKVDCVSHLMNRHARIETIQREMAKCDVVCSNCHRARTWKRRLQCL